jgi:hypothetical protein
MIALCPVVSGNASGSELWPKLCGYAAIGRVVNTAFAAKKLTRRATVCKLTSIRFWTKVLIYLRRRYNESEEIKDACMAISIVPYSREQSSHNNANSTGSYDTK